MNETCSYCGGDDHTVSHCPWKKKRDGDVRRVHHSIVIPPQKPASLRERLREARRKTS